MTDAEVIAALNPVQTLACTIWGEARGEDIAGKVAVASVIRNRIGRYGKDYKSVCLRRNQFSCWQENGGAANYAAVLTAARNFIRGGNLGPQMRECVWVADGVIGDALIDNTNHADHYLTRDLFKTKPPAWAKGQQPSAVIGAHVFLNLSVH
jgi:N-acetylmuramoyl-L-alanine amidase